MFIEKWGKRILIIKEYWKFIILNKKTPMDYYNSEFIYIDNEWIKWERGIDNWLLEIRARARQDNLILYILIQNGLLCLYIYLFISDGNSFVYDTQLRRLLVGIFVGIFSLSIAFFNDNSISGGPHLHHSPNLTEPHYY